MLRKVMLRPVLVLKLMLMMLVVLVPEVKKVTSW